MNTLKKIWTRQNNVHIFGKCCLRQSDDWTNRYMTRNVVNTQLNVTFEDRRWKAPSLAKIKFGKSFSLSFSKLDLCEGGSFSSTIFKWHWAKCLPHFVFYICLSVYCFVEGNICWNAQFCLVHIKKRLFLISYVFWFVSLNASSFER